MAPSEVQRSPEQGSDNRSWLRRALPLAAPAILVAIALLQLGRAHLLDQSSWAGVGFGMFATFENEQTRTVRLEITDGDGNVTAIDARRAADLELAAREVPTEDNLRSLAAWAFTLHPEATSIRVSVDGIDLATRSDGESRSVEAIDIRLASIEWTP